MNLFEPYDWQIAPLNDKSPVMLLTGGVGGGKSMVTGNKVDAFMRYYSGATGVVSRKVYEDARTSTIPFMKKISNCDDDPNINYRSKPDRIIYSHHGDEDSTLYLIGMKGGNKEATGIRSFGEKGEVDIWWMEEASEHEEDDYEEISGRVRGKAAPWTQIIPTTNPDAENHWINLRLIIGGEASVYYSGIEDNPSTPDAYRERVENMRGLKGRRLRDRKWVSGEGQVFDAWLDDFNPAQPGIAKGNVTLDAEYIPYNGRFVWYVDDGYSGEYDEKIKLFTAKSQPRAFLLGQERRDGTVAIFGEHLDVQILAEPHIAKVRDYCKRMGWPDKPAYAIYDGASPSLGGSLINSGITAYPIRCKISEGNKELNNWIGPDSNKVRRVIVHPRCRFVRYEMNAHVYDKNGVPLDANDHTLNACLVAGTMVETDNGPRPIEQLSRGVKVLTRNGYRPVTHAWMSSPMAATYTVELSNGQQLVGTADHPVFCDGEFVPLASLSPGNILSGVGVLRIYANETREPVYNIEVEGEEEYYASGVLVHNCKYGIWNKAYGRYRPVSVHALDDSGQMSEDRLAEMMTRIDLAVAQATAKVEKELEKYG
jgi:hypothetical protein